MTVFGKLHTYCFDVLLVPIVVDPVPAAKYNILDELLLDESEIAIDIGQHDQNSQWTTISNNDTNN